MAFLYLKMRALNVLLYLQNRRVRDLPHRDDSVVRDPAGEGPPKQGE